ncbi:hypothetical protein DTO169C6_8938 [Paecilomyces variotii]|nr:hypothetical protein DTO169C6_8938 [Paecilomyces variotii]KAJ9256888.1 hypothetical protein DTO195F2_5713 [Paecilomyces variotii]
MVTPTPCEHPIFKELAALQEGIDVFPNPEVSDYTSCRAYTKTATRCQLGLKGKAPRANALLSEFREMDECPRTDIFYHQLKEFLTITHCGKHQEKPLARLDEWRKQREQAASSLSKDTSSTATGTDYFSSIASLSEAGSTATSILPLSIEQPTEQCTDRSPNDSIDNIVIEDTLDITLTEGPSSPACQSIIDSLSSSSRSLRDAPSREQAPEITHCERVEELETGVEDLTLSTSHHTTASDGSCHDEAEVRITGIGLASLQRKGTLRDTSPVLKEIYKYLTGEEQKEGIVYVLEHVEIKGLFKVGCTRETAAKRHHQPGNCYGTNTKVIHETTDGPFVGAQKAKRLAQAILRHHKLQVIKCEQCGKGHKEWFWAQREVVLDTVKIVERFVQLPAYTLQDGRMKLSPVAEERMEKMCNFSLQRLEDLTAAWDAQFEGETHGPVIEESLHHKAREEALQVQNDSGSPGATKHGGIKSKFTQNARKALWKPVKESIDRLLNRSREATPEAGETETIGDRTLHQTNVSSLR